jgi:uncharacterized protein YcbK (DUF882 family)
VRAGQNLSRIAARYRVSVAALAAANRMRPDAPVQEGTLLTIPAEGTIVVGQGETLRSLARRYDVNEEALARANRIGAGQPLRAGQVLVLPGSVADRTPPPRWGRPRRPGVLDVYRIATQESKQVRVYDRRGRVRRQALRELAVLLASRQHAERKEPHPRLVRLLAAVSDHFGGRRIEVISGYRREGGYTRRESRHVSAEAIDFRVRGVPNAELRDFCRTFEHVGVGYYPNSLFVHLDVRQDSAYWVDYSRPGEPPRYGGAEGDPALLGRGRAARDDHDVPGEPPAPDDGRPPIDDAPGELSDE